MFSSTHHPSRPRLLAVAATLAALTGAAVATSSVASAQAQQHAITSTVTGAQLRRPAHRPRELSKPTVVLVHGGWADSSGWNAEITALQKKGYPVIAPANPLRGLSSDADYVRSVLQTIDGPIVLVGHSYGGAVISNAARGVDNVKALVYIAAFAPDTGETLEQLVTMNPGTHITPDALDARPYPLPDGTQASTCTSRPRSSARRSPATCPAGPPADAGHPAAVLGRRVRRALRCPGVEDGPVLVPGRHQRPRHPAGDPAVHGGPGRIGRQPGDGLARADDVPAQGDPGHHQGRHPRRRLTQPRRTHRARGPGGDTAGSTAGPHTDPSTQTSAAGPMNGYEKRANTRRSREATSGRIASRDRSWI